MKIYFASSWRHQHLVEALTKVVRNQGYEVISWVENNYEEGYNPGVKMDFEQWIKTESAFKSFEFDTKGAAECDLFIYLGQAGKDAAAECGIAYASKKPTMVALYQKGEDFGLMRKMFTTWFSRIEDLTNFTEKFIKA